MNDIVCVQNYVPLWRRPSNSLLADCTWYFQSCHPGGPAAFQNGFPSCL